MQKCLHVRFSVVLASLVCVSCIAIAQNDSHPKSVEGSADGFAQGSGHGSGQGSGETPAEELVVALLGDTGAGNNFSAVLNLVAAEKADVVMINGDFGYGASAEEWRAKLKSAIDTKAFPVIGALGNHDVSEKEKYIAAFSGFRADHSALKQKCTGSAPIFEGKDIIAVDETCSFGNVSIIASGIGQVLNTNYLENRLSEKLKAAPDTNWKLVGYHFTLTSMNPGIKGDNATSRFFDLIRQHGAIGAQAHTHSVMASCPIDSEFSSGKPVTCHPSFQANLEDRFIAPGVGVYVDSSLGGKDVRVRGRCKNPKENGCRHMVDLITREGYTRTDGTKMTSFNRYGAMFIVFNAGGDPSKALIYYKSIDGQVIFKFNVSRDLARP